MGKTDFMPLIIFSKLSEVNEMIICVPTPIGTHFEPDLQYIINSARQISKYIIEGHIIVLKSTTYPGTTEEEFLPILEQNGFKVGRDFFLGYSPEREDPGNMSYTTKTIPNIARGVTEKCCSIVEALYKQVVDNVFPVSSPRVAEAAKLLENIYKAVNIALVNELKVIFCKMDIDIWEVIEASKTKPFGFQTFYPGPGLGVHCIPIDPFYLTWKAREYEIYTMFIELAEEINNSMPDYAAFIVVTALNSIGKSINGAKVLILGMAYKPDVDDMRESPSLKLMSLLMNYGAKIDYNDPYISSIPPTRKYRFNMQSVELSLGNLAKYDAVILSTNHSNYDYKMIYDFSQLIIDMKNAFEIKGIRNNKVWKA